MSERESGEPPEPDTFPASPASESYPAERERSSEPVFDRAAPTEPEAPVEHAGRAEQAVPAERAAPAEREVDAGPVSHHDRAPNMLPGRDRRGSMFERLIVRVVATGGIIGIGVAVAAILGANNVQAWITGLVVSALSVVLAAILWSSQRL